MECFGNNINIDRVSLNNFVTNILQNKVRPGSVGSWSNVKEDITQEKWNNIVIELSRIEGCDKLVKVFSQGEDTILFVTTENTTKYFKYVNQKYLDTMEKEDIFYNLVILDTEELESWISNTNSITYWEKWNV